MFTAVFCFLEVKIYQMKGSEFMRKLLSVLLILSLLFSMAPVSLAEGTNLFSWEGDSWTNGNNKYYNEGDKVLFKFLVPAITGTSFAVDHDYEETNGGTGTIGFSSVLTETLKFYNSDNVQLFITEGVDYIVDAETNQIFAGFTNGAYSHIRLRMTINSSEVAYITWEVQLSDESAGYPGSTLQSREVDNGESTISFQVGDTGSLTIQKTWADDVPESGFIEFAVESNDKKIDPQEKFTLTVDSSNQWKATETLLPFGKYLITTETADGFEFETEQGFPIEVDITNKNPEITKSIENNYNRLVTRGTLWFEKAWSDVVPPTGSIEFTVQQPIGDPFTVTVTAAGGWTTSMSGMTLGSYSITTESATGLPMDSSFVYDSGLGVPTVLNETTQSGMLTVENDYDPPEITGELTFNKTWSDDVPQMGSVAFTVQHNQIGTFPVTVTAAGGWTTSMSGLALGNYCITTEAATGLPMGSNFTCVSGLNTPVELSETTQSGMLTVENDYDPPEITGDLTFNKTWTDDVPQMGSVEFTVRRNQEVPFPVTVTAAGGWTTSMSGMILGSYSITTESATGLPMGSDFTYVSGIDIPTELSETTQSGILTVENDYDPPLVTGELTFVKAWTDWAPPTGSVEFAVQRDQEVPFTVTVTAAGSWTTSMSGMILGSYRITTEAAMGLPVGSYFTYVSGIDIPTVLSETTQSGMLTVENDYDPPEVTGELTFVKAWTDEAPPTGSVEFAVQREQDDSFPVIVTAAGSWSTSMSGLALGSYSITTESATGLPMGSDFTYVSGIGTSTILSETTQSGMLTVENDYDPSDEPIDSVVINKTVAPTSHYTGGGPVDYTITFTNDGDMTYDSVMFEETMDSRLTTGNVTDFEVVFNKVDPTTSHALSYDTWDDFFDECIYLGDLGYFEPGDSIEITYGYISSGLSAESYVNYVTGSAYECNQLDGVMDSIEYLNGYSCDCDPAAWDNDDATLTVSRRSTPRDDDDPGVRIEKSVDVTEASVGDTVTFTLKVTNNGDVSLTDVMVVDDMIDVEWDIGGLSKGDSITETFEYTIKSGDFDGNLLENIAEVTADSREGKASDTDDATISRDGEEIIVIPEPTPETPPDVVVPPSIPPQALPQTGPESTGIFYGLGSLMLAAGYVLSRKRRD